MRAPLRLTLPLITQPGGVAAVSDLARDGWPARAKKLPGAGSGLASAHMRSNRASKVRAASGSRKMTMSLSCCLSPEADRLA